ncbi:MAG: N-6 DNA methylase, partial [Bacteroidaceae bacterium]|nr:N-6 DNA methylase [Bacteroidaceae bacterium]
MMNNNCMGSFQVEKSFNEMLWAFYNILRNSFMTSEYHIIFFFLTIFKDGLLDDLFTNRYESKRILVDRINNSDEYYEIAKIYLPLIEKLDNRQVNELIDLFSKFDSDTIKKDFDSIFEYFLYKIFDVIGINERCILQPIELTQLINEISEFSSCERIYNPFAGLASFSINLKDNQSYYGQELNQSTWAIGKLRLMANGLNKPVEYKNENSIDIWPENERFDLIVSFPPMGAKLRYMNSIHYNEYSTVEQFLIEKGISSLNLKGKLISILPLNFLHKSGYEQTIRERIVNEDLLDMIILMPSGLLKHTNTPFCIIILNKAKSNFGIVRFVNAQNYISNDNIRNKCLDVESLVELIKDDNDNDTFKHIDNSFIRENNYNLNVIKYFTKEYSGINIFQEYCYFFDGNRSNEREKGKYVRIRDLKDDKINNRIEIANIEDVDIPKYAKRIEESCLLVARLGKNLKPTYFNFEDVPIFISNDIFSIKVNQEKINIDYLINELLSDDVIEQLNSFRLGIIPSIKKDDLLQIKIKILSIQEQNAKVKGLMELSSQIKLLQEERDAIVHGAKINNFNEFASLKHSIGAPRQ